MPTILLLGLENAGVASVLAIILGACTPWLRRRPALAHVLWALVLVKLVTPPLQRFALPSVLPAAAFTTVEPATAIHTGRDFLALVANPETLVPDEPSEPAPAPPAPPTLARGRLATHIPTGVLLVWGLGSATTLVLILLRARHFSRLLRLADPVDDPTLELVHRVANRLDLARRPTVRTLPGVISPVVWSLGRTPLLLLPADLWKRLDRDRRETLVAHELAHLKRGDDRLRLLEVAATVLYWWLPVVYWARRALRDAEEQCCDAWVISAFPGSSRAYAETLIDAIDFLNGAPVALPVSASGFGHPHQLKRRVIMVMKGNTPRSLDLAGGLLSLAVSAALLPVGPTFALAAGPDPASAPRTTPAENSEPHPIRITINQAHADGPRDNLDRDLIDLVVNVDENGKTLTEDFKGVFVFKSDEATRGLENAIAELSEEMRDARASGDRLRAEALFDAVAGLKKALSSQEKAKTSETRTTRRERLPVSVEPRDAEARRPNPDELNAINAEIKERHAQIRDLQKAMAEAHRKLAEATRKLHAASGPANTRTIQGQHINSRTITTPGDKDRKVVEFTTRFPAHAAARDDARADAAHAASLRRMDANPDQERRLDDLEKKLERVLDELSSLKGKSENRKP